MILIFFVCTLKNVRKSISGRFKIFTQDKPSCYLLKNKKCKVTKVIADNDYMTFPYKILVGTCIGSVNENENPDLEVCLPDSIKNITVKSFDLLSKKIA